MNDTYWMASIYWDQNPEYQSTPEGQLCLRLIKEENERLQRIIDRQRKIASKGAERCLR